MTKTRIRLAAAFALPVAGTAFAGAPAVIDLGIADDDVWAYVSAVDPATAGVINAWGSNDLDLNPQGFPGTFPQSNFWSHVFVGWDTGVLPADFRWGGAEVRIRLGSNTWVPEEGDVFIRFLSRGFDEATWSIFGNTPAPVPALGQVTGVDAGATVTGDTITFTIPADLDPAIVFEWLSGGQVFFAITADNAPPPPQQGMPPDLTGALQIFSSEDIFARGPRLTLIPGRLGDANGDGVVDFADLNVVLSNFNVQGDGLAGDLNRDGSVDFTDLNEVISFFNT